MTKDKETTIDSDHEIEEFLQEFIVEKVTSGYEVYMTEIKEGVNELREQLFSIKNTSNTINQDISRHIINDENLLGDVDDITESLKKTDKKVDTVIKLQSEIKGIIPTDEKIIEALSIKWETIIDEKIVPIQADISNCITTVSTLSNEIDGVPKMMEILSATIQEILSKVESVDSELNSLKELLRVEQVNIGVIENVTKRIEESINNRSDDFLKNDEIILQVIRKLNQKTNFLWITVGIDTALILGLLIAYICK